MKITHHPGLESLMSCSAGSMPEAFAAVMAAHIATCPQCQKDLAVMEDIGVALLDQLSPTALSEPAPVMAFRRLEAEAAGPDTHAGSTIGDVPEVLVPVVGSYLDDIKWKKLANGITHYQIPLSKTAQGDLRLIKIAPGTALPEHGHGGSELTLILRGAYSDKTGTYRTGDVADLTDNIEHQPVADAHDGCICLVATDSKLRFKTLMARMMQPLTGM